MDDSIFRKKSLERVSSPDSLNHTIRVTQPAVWLLLVALILVLVGFFVWSIFGTLNSTVDAVIVSKDGNIGCYVSEQDASEVATGMDVVVGAQVGELGNAVDERSHFASEIDSYVVHKGNFDPNEYIYYYEVAGDVPEGTYAGKVITDKINAISFLWN